MKWVSQAARAALLATAGGAVVAVVLGTALGGDPARPLRSCSGPTCAEPATATPTPVWPGRR